jgi:hypothetical protein
MVAGKFFAVVLAAADRWRDLGHAGVNVADNSAQLSNQKIGWPESDA